MTPVLYKSVEDVLPLLTDDSFQFHCARGVFVTLPSALKYSNGVSINIWAYKLAFIVPFIKVIFSIPFGLWSSISAAVVTKHNYDFDMIPA